MRLELPKVYPITDVGLSGLSHAEQVQRLIDGGATFIQLREKRLPPIDFLREAEAAWKIAQANRATLIINDRVDIAMALGSPGVHLGQNDLPVRAARALLKDRLIIGFSTHTLEQVDLAVPLPLNYIAFGPVFGTHTKANPDATVGTKALAAARKLVGDIPLVAIGGITAENIREVLDAGADSAAVVSALFADRSRISQNMRRLLDLCAT